MSLPDLLKRVQLFANLQTDELEQLAAICQEQQIPANQQIIKQNTTGKEMYIVAQGSAEVYIQGIDDARSLVVLGKGQVIGEMALIDQVTAPPRCERPEKGRPYT